MDLARAAYVNLRAMALADGRISPEETALLEKYRAALGITTDFARETARTHRRATPKTDIEATPGERVHLMEMLVRLAYEDGTLDRKERKLLRRVAASIGVGRLEFANILVSVAARGHEHRRHRRAAWVTLGFGLVVVVSIWTLWTALDSRADHRSDSDRQRFERLEASLGAVERRGARESAARVSAAADAQRKIERDLAERIRRLESRSDPSAPSPSATPATPGDWGAELATLRRELAEIREANAAFQAIERDASPSVLMISCRYALVRDRHRIERWGSGTGFFITASGYLVTNKHVIHGWKFQPDDRKLVDEGYRVDPGEVFIGAWPAGSVVKLASGSLDLSTGYSTVGGDLTLVRTADDLMQRATRVASNGEKVMSRYHALDHHDLALLKVRPHGRLRALSLAPEGHVPAKLARVMVLGYPGGISVRESRVAITAPSLGEVRKVEQTIFVTAPIVPGNSGGPLLDRHGHVLGVASSIFGASTVGGCLPVHHVVALLPVPAVLLDECDALMTEDPRGAFDLLELLARCDAPPDALATRRATLEARLNDLMERASTHAREGRRDAARASYERVIGLFGPRWAPDAAAQRDALR